MKEMLRLVFSLLIVTVIATGLLSITYSLTRPFIDQAQQTMFDEQLQSFFPGYDEVIEIDERLEVYKGTEMLGYAVLTTAPGYGGDIELLVAVALDRTVAGVSVLRQQETPGLGARIVEEQFLSQFRGMSAEDLELTRFGGEVDAITSATISSERVTSAVRVTVEELS